MISGDGQFFYLPVHSAKAHAKNIGQSAGQGAGQSTRKKVDRLQKLKCPVLKLFFLIVSLSGRRLPLLSKLTNAP